MTDTHSGNPVAAKRRIWRSVDEGDLPQKEGKYLCAGFNENSMRVGWFTRANATSDGKFPTFPAYVKYWSYLPKHPDQLVKISHEATRGTEPMMNEVVEGGAPCKRCEFYHRHLHRISFGKWKACRHPAYLGTSECEICNLDWHKGDPNAK